MAKIRFVQVDVFTDKPFAGNPLAVILDGRGLSTEKMQAIAKEMNLSETTFVLPPEDASAHAKVRIFTPAMELPFAGHPVVGTAYVMATELTKPPSDGTFEYKLELGVGVLPVEVSVVLGDVARTVMTQKPPEFGRTLGADEINLLAKGLGLDSIEITGTGLPTQLVSTGYTHLMVPIRSLAAIGKIQLDLNSLQAACKGAGVIGPYVFTRETVNPDAHAHARLFAPGAGIVEDPATGSAAGPLAAYLVHHRVITAHDPVTTIIIEQGIEMGRPSRIDAEVERTEKTVTKVRIGGQTVKVMEGTILA